MGQWVVQEGGWDMKSTPPNFGGGGHSVRQAGQSKVKATPNTKWMVTKKTVDPAKKGVEKKNLVSVVPGGIDLLHLPKCPRDPPFGPVEPQERLDMMDRWTSLPYLGTWCLGQLKQTTTKRYC